MVRRLVWAYLCVSLGLSLFVPGTTFAQDEDSDAEDEAFDEEELDPTGRKELKQANEAAEAAEESEETGEPIDAEFAEDDDQFLSAAELSEEALDTRINTMDAYLEDIQRPSRLYWYGWVTTQIVLTAGQAFLATQQDQKAVRTGYIVGSSVSGASLLLILFSPYPGRSASSRYRALPTGTREEKELKLAAGEGWLIAQAKQDALRTSWAPHVLGALVAAGTGIGLAAAYDHNLRDAVTRTISIFFVSQLQILTRPRRAMEYVKSYSRSPNKPELVFAPLITDRHAMGMSLAGRF